ncbi:MAG: HEPN domain-containing protein [Cyanobacteria bacterium P01_F01_bin.116]
MTAQLFALADEDLETARLLLDNVRYRACISRAYYAMYYGTQALLNTKEIANRTHKGMIQQFSLHFVKPGDFSAEMSKQLGDMYDLRQLSDYEADVAINQEQAEQALVIAVEFVGQVKGYLESGS